MTFPRKITITNPSGATISLPLTENVRSYEIGGTIVATGNFTIQPSGTPKFGDAFNIYYRGTFDITTNSTTFNIFGQLIPQPLLLVNTDLFCFYDGLSWKVVLSPSFLNSSIVSTNHLEDGAVTNNKISSVNGNKIINNTIDASLKIQDLSIPTSKIQDLAVTNAKINDVNGSKIVNTSIDASLKLQDASISTSKIIDGTISNTKLSSMPNLALKGSDAVGAVTDVALSDQHFLLRNGASLSSIPIRDYSVIYRTVIANLDDELTQFVSFDHLQKFEIHSAIINVIEPISGSGKVVFFSGNYTLPLGFTGGGGANSNELTVNSTVFPNYTTSVNFLHKIEFTTNKDKTVGGGVALRVINDNPGSGKLDITFTLIVKP